MRNTQAEKSRIDSFMLRKQLMAKVEEMCSPDILVSELSIMTEEMRCIEKEITKKDKVVTERMKYKNLSEDIIGALEDLDKDLYNKSHTQRQKLRQILLYVMRQ